MIKRPNILLIYTGGTIGMKTDPETGVLVPFNFNDIYEEFPYVRKLGVEIEAMVFKAIDSSNVTPDLWKVLAEIVRDNYDNFDGFVVLHGTDTMAYSASALSFMIENLGKPVVFTGSQIPIGVMRTDGRENLITAIEIAAAHDTEGRPLVPEVSLYFQNRLFRANRSTKYSAEELNAFRSENYPSLADVGVNIHYNENNIMRPWPEAELSINSDMVSDILVLKIFPGLTEKIFRSMLSVNGLKGVVLETYGSGNAPTVDWFIDAVTEAVDSRIPVVNVTQCPSGAVDMDMYETGIRLQEAGVISARDATTEAMVTKLMYVLGLGLKYDETVEMMRRPLRGEMSL